MKPDIATTKPRMLIFSTAYLPMVGGVEVAIKEITDRLGPKWEFEMITCRLDKKFAKEEQVGNVLVHRLGVGHLSIDKLLVPFVGAWKVWQINKERKIDLFWCVQVTYASGAAYIFNIFNKNNNVPIVLTLQEGDSEEHLSKRHFGLINLAWKLALGRTRYLTALSTYLLKRSQSLGYRGDGNIIPNGVDVNLFGAKLAKPKRNALRKELGIDEDDFVIVTTSRLVTKNAVEDIVKSLAYLPKEVKFLCIGFGPLESDLKLIAKTYNLLPRIKWLGFVPNHDLPSYLHISDVFIRPSLSEGLGVSFIEAMAGGLPIIATPVGGIPDFLHDGVTGLFCEVNNPVDLAEKVKILMANPTLRKDIIKNARDVVQEKYDWQKIVGDMQKVFTNAKR